MERSGPWGTSGASGVFFQDDWRKLMRGLHSDGVIGDPDGNSLKVTATGSSTQLQVAPGKHLIQGALYENDATLTLDLAAFGTPPSSGQTRVDLVILRYDPTAKTVVATINPGAPATSGADEAALTRLETGVWEHRLARIDRVGNVAVNQSMISDRRTWTTPGAYTPFMDGLSNAPIGALTVRIEDGGDIERRGTSGGVATWISLLDPAWTTLTTSADTSLSDPPAKWRIRGGLVEVVGAVAKSSGTWSAGNVVHAGTIPSQARPSADSFGVVACIGGPTPEVARAIIRASTGRIEVVIPVSGVNGLGLNGLCWDV